MIAMVLFLDSSHLPAPIALAWGHPEFRRRIALAHKMQFIAIPVFIVALAVLTVPVTLIFWPGFHPIIGTKIRAVADRNSINPFTVMLTLFVVWNLYHFGSQNFGVWRLWRRGQGNRFLQKSSWVGATFVGMVGVPFVAPMLTAISMWAFGLWHWLPAIWLAAKVSRRPVLFWAAMVLVGALIAVSVWGAVAYGSLAVAMIAVGARLGLGFVHFLYDRWIWRLSDPQVRATIGNDLFREAESRTPVAASV